MSLQCRARWWRLGWPSAVALLTVAVGCSRSASKLDARERADERMIKAEALAESGDMDGALRLYEQVLRESPDVALAHLRVAFIYQDTEKDMVMALYHYRRYMELRPDAEKEPVIRLREHYARLAFLEEAVAAASVTVAATPVEEDASSQSEIVARLGALAKEREALATEIKGVINRQEIAGALAEERGRADAAEERARRAEEQAGAMRASLDRVQGEVQQACAAEAGAVRRAEEQAKRIETLERSIAECETRFEDARQTIEALRRGSGAVDSGASRTGSAAAPAAPGRPALPARHVVKTGETLSGIALQYYGDALRWRPIFDANEAVLSATGRLRPGQVLRIPALDEQPQQ